jgi:thioredoxin 2
MPIHHLLTDCPACGSQNRVRIERLGQAAKCGRCKADLGADVYSDAPVEIAEGEFESLIRHSRIPVLVDFWAEWCAPCRQLAPILEHLAAELQRRVLMVKLDTEAARFVPSRFAIQAIPTLVLLRSGLEVDRIAGLMSAAALRQRLERFL